MANKKRTGNPNIFNVTRPKLPSGVHFKTWCRSLESQLRHEKAIMDEAIKCNANPKYKPSMKIGKKYNQYFLDCIVEAQRREERRKKNAKKKTKKARKVS